MDAQGEGFGALPGLDGELLTAAEEEEVAGEGGDAAAFLGGALAAGAARSRADDARLAARLQAIEGLQPVFEPVCVQISDEPVFAYVLVIAQVGGSAWCAAPSQTGATTFA